MAAIKRHGDALEHASKYLRDTEEIVFEAVKQDDKALDHASERIKEIIRNLEHDGTIVEKFAFLNKMSKAKSARMAKVI